VAGDISSKSSGSKGFRGSSVASQEDRKTPAESRGGRWACFLVSFLRACDRQGTFLTSTEGENDFEAWE
jgi:hypothetical protein